MRPIRREIVVAQSDGFSEVVVAQSDGFRGDWWTWVCFSPIKSVLFGRACRVWDGCVEAEKGWWRASRIPGQMDRSVFLHNTEKEFLCLVCSETTEYSFRRGSSRKRHEGSNITLTPSCANHLDIFQFAANHNWLGIGYTAANMSALTLKCLLLILFLLHCTACFHHTFYGTKNPTFILSLIYIHVWHYLAPAPFNSCYLAHNLKEVARACPTS